LWRDHLEKVTQYYFLATYYHEVDKKRYEKYAHRYHHHLKQYVESYERSGTNEFPVPSQVRRSQIRLLHTAIAAARQPVDVYIDGKFIATVSYLKPNPHISVSAGRHKITLYPTKRKSRPIFEQEISLERGKRYLLVVADKSNNPQEGLQILRYEETGRVLKDRAKLRFIHLSPNIPKIDLSDQQHGISFRDVTYKENTRYEGLGPGRVNIRVTVVGTRDRIAAIAFDAKRHQAYTVIVAGHANNPQWILLLDR
jgi:hypothetical protein